MASKSIYPWDVMRVGDYFVVYGDAKYDAVRQAAVTRSGKDGKRFLSKKFKDQTGSGTIVYRSK